MDATEWPSWESDVLSWLRQEGCVGADDNARLPDSPPLFTAQASAEHPSVFDVLAWYGPITYYGERFAIVITDEGIDQLSAIFSGLVDENTSRSLAQETLWLHEYFHHLTEAWSIRLHAVTGIPRYGAYHELVYKPNIRVSDNLHEEALAQAYALRNLRLNAFPKETAQRVKSALRTHMIQGPPGYRRGASLESDDAFSEGLVLLARQISLSTLDTHPFHAPPVTIALESLGQELTDMHQHTVLARKG